jgi:hypothetical protein
MVPAIRTDFWIQQYGYSPRVHPFEFCEVIDRRVDDDPLPVYLISTLALVLRQDTHQIIRFIVL